MALVSPGIQISVNDQSQYVGSNTGSVPLVLLATAQDKTYNGSSAVGTSKKNAGKLLSFTSQRDLVTAMGTPSFQLSSAGTPINAGEINEYGLLAAYSALGLGNRLFAIRADVDLNQLKGTAVRPTGAEADGTFWLDLANTEFGLYELDAAANAFSHLRPLLITDAGQIAQDTDFGYPVGKPKNSIGQQGSYALVFTNPDGTTANTVRLYYKSDLTALVGSDGGPGSNAWVAVGSTAWQLAIVAAQGTQSSGSITIPNSSTFTINNQVVYMPGTGTLHIVDVANQINSASIAGIKAQVVGGKLSIYVTSAAKSNGTDTDGGLIIQESDSINRPLSLCGLSASTYWSPYLHYGNYASAPTGGWYSTDSKPRPSGSVWWKTTSTGTGYSPVLKKYSSSLGEWVSTIAPAYAYYKDAINSLDPVGGGIDIGIGQVITQIGREDTTANNFRFAEQMTTGETVTTGSTPISFAGANSYILKSTVPGQPSGSATYYITTITTSGTTATTFVSDILAANIPYVTARVNNAGTANETVSIIHTTGGEIRITETSGTPLANAGFTASYPGTYIFSNFENITTSIKYSSTTPYAAPTDGALWYYSNLADVDVMINDNGWKGYQNVTADVRGYQLNLTDSAGVIVSASKPTSQTNGNGLVAGDLWLDSSDTVNYPALYRYNGTTFVALDTTDHVSNNGIVFADARWASTGTVNPVSDSLPSTVTLLTSNYLDLDAPDYRLYPRGTLLFNTRRSGYNVKKYISNYFNSVSFPPDAGNTIGLPTATPEVTDAWVSDSGLKEDGSMYAGSGAQRAIVVAALRAAVDSNTDVLDANYNFNLLVAPGYPELIPNLVTLNDNRSDTGFVIGDTPMTLAPSTTDITAWNTNANGNGLATSSPYLAVYYPAGLTNDLAGNQVAVPASHAVLRTFLYNDNVSYQWFAPAGVHRGLVGNLNDIGYVNATTGAFVHNGVNQGLRDSLYTLSINPITQLPGTGIVVWGQETKSGDTTARNRVNVVRLENYLRTVFNTIANGFLFEPNDTITRKSIATQIESALHNLLSKRGLYDFLVICDTSNNTPSTIANNQLYVDVAVEPMRDVEFIYIPIALYNPGTVATLGAAST